MRINTNGYTDDGEKETGDKIQEEKIGKQTILLFTVWHVVSMLHSATLSDEDATRVTALSGGRVLLSQFETGSAVLHTERPQLN